MKKVAFTCGTGINWFNRCKVTLSSYKSIKDCDLYLFTDDKRFLSQKIDGVTIIKVEPPVFEGGPKDSWLSESSMCLRLSAMDYLSKLGYDVALYTDSDALIINALPDSFWVNRHGCVEDMIFSSTKTTIAKVSAMRQGYVKRHLYSKNLKYFNSGVMRIALQEPEIKAGVLDQYLQFRNGEWLGKCLDQDFLNMLLAGKWEALGGEYNVHCWSHKAYSIGDKALDPRLNMSTNEYMGVVNHWIHNSYITHWAGEKKPWEKAKCEGILKNYFHLPTIWCQYALTVDIDEQVKERCLYNIKAFEDYVYANISLPFPTERPIIKDGDNLLNFC